MISADCAILDHFSHQRKIKHSVKFAFKIKIWHLAPSFYVYIKNVPITSEGGISEFKADLTELTHLS